jgi:hypothetical protein
MFQKHSPSGTSPSNTVPDTEPRSPHGRLQALLSLVTDEPTVFLPLAEEVRNSTLFVGVVTEGQAHGTRRRMVCGQQGDVWYAISFVDRTLAENYFSQAASTGQISGTIQLQEYPGLDLLQVLSVQEPALGLEIIAPSFDKLVDPSWVAIMAKVYETDTKSMTQHEYHLISYSGTASRELIKQLRLFCEQHHHIERLYICDNATEGQPNEAMLVLVGNRPASTVNIPDLIGEVVLRIGLDGWGGEIAWVLPEDAESLSRIGMDPIYTAKRR